MREPAQDAEGVAALHVSEVQEEDDQQTVNFLLGTGDWVLLSVGQDPYGVPHYVLGRRLIDGAES